MIIYDGVVHIVPRQNQIIVVQQGLFLSPLSREQRQERYTYMQQRKQSRQQ